MKQLRGFIIFGLLVLGGMIWGIAGLRQDEPEVIKEGDSIRNADAYRYYGIYSVDYEARRLYTRHQDSAISGTEAAYQWNDKMEYEKIKQFDHKDTQAGVQVKIVRYDEGKEEVICDYVYTLEEYDERLEDIWGIYYEDFIWEKEVTDKATGKKYMLRYAEVFHKEMAAHNNGVYYDGRLYVYDEDTYLIRVWHSEQVIPSSSITWKDGRQELIIYYEAGYAVLPLESLLHQDY